jgi:hypothetical protein
MLERKDMKHKKDTLDKLILQDPARCENCRKLFDLNKKGFQTGITHLPKHLRIKGVNFASWHSKACYKEFKRKHNPSNKVDRK